MGIIKLEDVIAWQKDGGLIVCDNCAGDATDDMTPLMEEDYDASEYAIVCDDCKKRIL